MSLLRLLLNRGRRRSTTRGEALAQRSAWVPFAPTFTGVSDSKEDDMTTDHFTDADGTHFVDGHPAPCCGHYDAKPGERGKWVPLGSLVIEDDGRKRLASILIGLIVSEHMGDVNNEIPGLCELLGFGRPEWDDEAGHYELDALEGRDER